MAARPNLTPEQIYNLKKYGAIPSPANGISIDPINTLADEMSSNMNQNYTEPKVATSISDPVAPKKLTGYGSSLMNKSISLPSVPSWANPNIEMPKGVGAMARGAAGGLAKTLPYIAAGVDAAQGAINVGALAKDSQSSASDVAAQTAEEIAKFAGGTLAGGGLGAQLGMAAGALTGPAAPVASPVLGVIGGIGGAIAGKEAVTGLIKTGRKALGLQPSSDMVDAAKARNQAEQDRVDAIKASVEAKASNMPGGPMPANGVQNQQGVPQSIDSPPKTDFVNAKMNGNIPASLADRGLPSATDAMQTFGVLDNQKRYVQGDVGKIQGNEAGIGPNVGARSPWDTGAPEKSDRQIAIDNLMSRIDNSSGGSIGESVMRNIRNKNVMGQIDQLSKVDAANRNLDNASVNSGIAQQNADTSQYSAQSNSELGKERNAIDSARQQSADQIAMVNQQRQAAMDPYDIANKQADTAYKMNMSTRDPESVKYDAQNQAATIKFNELKQAAKTSGNPFRYSNVDSWLKQKEDMPTPTPQTHELMGKKPNQSQIADYESRYGIPWNPKYFEKK